MNRLTARAPERSIVTTAADILLLEADGDFTKVTVSGEQPLLICQAIGTFERTLPGPPLVRLDRSLMVNTERVETIEVSPTRGARVTLRGLEPPVELGRCAKPSPPLRAGRRNKSRRLSPAMAAA